MKRTLSLVAFAGLCPIVLLSQVEKRFDINGLNEAAKTLHKEFPATIFAVWATNGDLHALPSEEYGEWTEKSVKQLLANKKFLAIVRGAGFKRIGFIHFPKDRKIPKGIFAGYSIKTLKPIAGYDYTDTEVESKPVVSKLKFPISRSSFKFSLLGKEADEVIKILGRPSNTEDYPSPDGDSAWIYYGATINPVTGKKDMSSRVNWRNGIVCSVNYN